jgi:glycosyltransferase involved in cell wall biosynthesis
MPRRAIIVGSFDWVAKRQALVALLEAADLLFAHAGIELYVVGQADESFLNRLRRSTRATIFTGRVEDVAIYMREARLAIVPDRMPGFKLKGLDYVFNALPIFALAGSLPGMPLADGESARFFSDYGHLAAGVITAIDDLETLNRLHERAYDICRDQFDWNTIGRRLRFVIEHGEKIGTTAYPANAALAANSIV